MVVQKNLETIKQDIKEACQNSNRNPDDVEIIAVTKYVSLERAIEALDVGINHLGENRLEGFLHKYEEIGPRATWHFIGTLQSRKVKDIIDHIDYVHSLDRSSLAKEINKRANKQVPCFVQVNVSGEESKHGIQPEDVQAFVEKMKNYENIQIVGLMTMALHVDDEEVLRGCFQMLRELKETIQNQGYSHAPCQYLSMGMSNDYRIAVEEGATHIRVGSKLVGREIEE
ncbi:YggS family pyridoxal phosphate-dependent enzyme [Salinibacillus xinjiangensis]|uniref:Pyridoxal phosphate homeostasis protein n=1 Tax=Salinibacillus xinjiangensis TaxID=1229268 RepID=A0A6G1X3S2_9BACI|nr:YggS family pyridoxal phosphate-dependent enzyme [Salinibacillus xinjiangensis]MRG85478.1 YggS family pyridoxal phosphate-dependent enzyme [Salinibacillus xinjiangensis]